MTMSSFTDNKALASDTRDRREGDTVPVSLSSSSCDGLPEVCTAGTSGALATAKTPLPAGDGVCVGGGVETPSRDAAFVTAAEGEATPVTPVCRGPRVVSSKVWQPRVCVKRLRGHAPSGPPAHRREDGERHRLHLRRRAHSRRSGLLLFL